MKNVATLFVLLALISTASFADVAPDPGYKQESADLILEPATDLSTFRFVLDSPAEIEEIKIAAEGRTVIRASGRAGASRFGRLIAIPAREYEQFANRLTEEEFRKALREKKLFTSIELLAHNFQTTIPEGASYQDPVYRIEKDDHAGLRALLISGGASGAKSSTGIADLGTSWYPAGIAIVAGVLLMCGITILGIWYFRRSSKHP
jgi:hypothetical protein